MRVALYARFSSKNQNPMSSADQLAFLREAARRAGWTVVAEFADDAISGASMTNRPQVQELIRAAKAGHFNAVLVESFDRLTRGFADGPRIFEELAFLGVKIFSPRQGFYDKTSVAIQSLLGSLALDLVAEKTLRGHLALVESGRIAGGTCYGYDLEPGEKRGGRTVNNLQAAIVQRIFEEFVAGVGPRKIAQRLNAEGHQGPPGAKWNASAIYGFLANELYIGRHIYNRHRFVKDPEGNRCRRAKPESEWKVKELPGLAIIDPKVWEAAQALRSKRGRPHLHHLRRPRHLLSGLMACGVCSSNFVVRNTVGERTYLGCSAHIMRRGCNNRRLVTREEVERRVLGGLQKLLRDPARIELMINAYRVEWKRLKAERAKYRSTTEHELAKVETAIARTLKAIHSPAGGDVESLAQSLRDLEQQRKQLRAKLAVPTADVVDLHPHIVRRCEEIIETFNETLAAGGPTAAKAMDQVRSLISSIRINPTPGRQPVDIEIEGNLLALIDPERSASEPFATVAVRV